VVGVDQQWQFAGTIDPIGLLREFGQRQHHYIGRAEHRE
jgi:hypothetical protein